MAVVGASCSVVLPFPCPSVQRGVLEARDGLARNMSRDTFGRTMRLGSGTL